MELSNRPGEPTPSLGPEKTSVAGGLMPLLAAAREKLKNKDLPAALALYESILANASDRSDVLMTISADLGTNGYVQEIIELLAPRYDVEKHGAPAGYRQVERQRILYLQADRYWRSRPRTNNGRPLV